MSNVVVSKNDAGELMFNVSFSVTKKFLKTDGKRLAYPLVTITHEDGTIETRNGRYTKDGKVRFNFKKHVLFIDAK